MRQPNGPATVRTLDDSVRAVTAFSSWPDLKDTQPTYAPKFYGQPASSQEAFDRRRVVASFNAWAARVGREVRAFDASTAGA